MKKNGCCNKPKIDFFIVGHPRCGSGYINAALANFPKVYMARKELHYYGRDLDYNRPARSELNYSAHFSSATKEQCVGESSTWYLYSKFSAEEIHRDYPKAKIIILLRDPLKWLQSLHAHFLFTGDESEDCFFKAYFQGMEPRLDLESYSTQPAGALCYRNLLNYSQQVDRYYHRFGCENVKLVMFERLMQEPLSVLHEILNFLGVDEGSDKVALSSSRRSVNSNRTVRSRLVRKFVRSPNNLPVLKGLSNPSVPGWQYVIRALHRANIQYERRSTIPKNHLDAVVDDICGVVQSAPVSDFQNDELTSLLSTYGA